MAALADSTAGFYGEVSSSETPDVFGRGARYAVGGGGDLKVTAGGAGDRAVTVAAGKAWGDAVLATHDTSTVLNAAANSSGDTGSIRWDTLVERRVWVPGVGGTATLTLLTGGSSQTLAPGVVLRNPTPSTGAGYTTADQPIALVGVVKGAATVSAANIVDLRLWSGEGGGLYGAHVKARDYVTSVGTTVRIGDVLHTRVLDGSGTPQWNEVNLGLLASLLVNAGGVWLTNGTGSAGIANDGGFMLRPDGLTAKWRVAPTGELTHGDVPFDHVSGTPVGIRYGGDAWSFGTSTNTAYPFSGGGFTYEGGIAGVSSGGMSVPLSGWYQITANMRWASNGTGVRTVQIQVGSAVVAEHSQDADGAANSGQNVTALVKLSAGDQVRMIVRQTSGGNLQSAPTGSVPRLSVVWVGA